MYIFMVYYYVFVSEKRLRYTVTIIYTIKNELQK